MNVIQHAYGLRLSTEAEAPAAPIVRRLPSKGDGNGDFIRGEPFGDRQCGDMVRKTRN